MWLEPPTPPKGVPRRTAAGPRHHFSARAVAPKADDLPKIAEKADDLEAIKKAVEDAAAVSGALWFSYLFVLFYFAIAAGAVTHQDLFFEHPVKLPFLGIELPLVAFFFLAPILFLVVHAYTLVHLVMLADKAKRYHQALYEQMGDKDGLSDSEREDRKAKRDSLRRQLPSNIFVELLAGPSDLRESTFGWLLRAIAWLTLVIAPVLLLLLFQVQFLPFHNGFITWTHRVALTADLVLLAWLWRKILPDRELGGPFGSWVWEVLGLTVSLAVILLSWATITFPGEWQEGHLPEWRILPALAEWGQPKKETLREWVFNSTKLSPHDWLFAEEPNPVTHRRLPFSSTLVLPSLNVYEGLGMDDPEKAKWHDFVFRARGRDLKGAIFDFASLPKVDFEGAQLQGASLERAQLQGVSLASAQLQGASLNDALLQGAWLDGAQLQGASLVDALLEGASLFNTQLQGASLFRALLEGASLFDAQLQGASLVDAQLQGASLVGAQLQGASLVGAQLQGASFEHAVLEATDLSDAHLWRADHTPPPSVAAVRVSGGDKTWLPLWQDEFGREQPWDGKAYQALRTAIGSLVPVGASRDNALWLIQNLDCSSSDEKLASCDPKAWLAPLLKPPPEAEAWRKALEAARANDTEYADALAKALKGLVCSGDKDAIYVLRGAGFQARLVAADTAAPGLIDDLTSKNCSVAASLTGADRANLLRIKQEAIKKPGG